MKETIRKKNTLEDDKEKQFIFYAILLLIFFFSLSDLLTFFNYEKSLISKLLELIEESY